MTIKHIREPKQCFNPRTHAGCDGFYGPSRWLYIAFQSTHPRRVRRDGGDRYYDSSDVSIHAPTQGATNGFSGHLASSLSFNPRTHAGCDFLVRLEHRAARVVFNPRTHAGATSARRPKARSDVSIHAPTQGATPRRRPCRRCPARFNPRTHAGATRNSSANGTTPPCFNPRTHAGVRRVPSIRLHRCVLRFNPRTHAGCDGDTAEPDGAPAQFQSTHPRRCDPAAPPRLQGRLQFQSTHPRRVRPRPGPGIPLACRVSIHAPTQGCDAAHRRVDAFPPCFNPRTHAGATASS